MKLHKLLTINGEPVSMNTDDVRLNLFSPGRAAFKVASSEKLQGIVEFSIGYKPNSLSVLFRGFIENSFQVDKKQHTIFCREFSAALNRILPINLRNCSLADVLQSVNETTAVEFVCAQQAYSQRKAPAFYSIGNGYHCMDALARIYRVPNMIWQQQGDGKVFVGSWEHSYWANKEVPLPVEWQATSGISNSALVPVVPNIRPGVKFTTGEIITDVSYGETHMDLAWAVNPWGTRWINKSTVL